MKRIVLALTAMLLLLSVSASAQVRFGVTGGLGFNKTNFTDVATEKDPVGWHAGAALSIDLPAGFTIQPALQYHQKGAFVSKGITQKMGYVELPVSFQWGPDLLIFRPFVDVTPFVGYAVDNETVAELSVADIDIASLNLENWDGKERLEYGLGLGGGIEVWRLQFVARYIWSFGPLYDLQEWADLKEHLSDLDSESKNFGGVTIGLSLFF